MGRRSESEKNEKGKGCRKLFTAGILCLLLLLMASCGKEERGRQLGIDGYVYVPEALPLPNAWVNIFKAYDHYLYYKKMYDTGLTTIKGISADGGEDREITVYVPYGDLADFCVDEEGAVYYFLQNSMWSSDYSSVTYNGGCLIKMLPDGGREYLLELPETNIMWDSGSCLAVDSNNQVLLLAEDAIWLIDARGELAGRISTEEYKAEENTVKEYLTEGGEDRIYYIVEDRTNKTMTFYELFGSGNYQLRKDEELSGARMGMVYGSDCGLLCDDEEGTLYRYDPESASWKELMYWGDSNLNSWVSAIAWVTDDRLAAYYQYGEGEDRSERALYLLTRTPVEEIPEKEILVLATRRLSDELEYSILKFNRNSSQYHIMVENYETEDDVIRLDGSLVSSDPPDMLDLSKLDVIKYSDKQVLEDLGAFLENSTVLKREDFLENALDGYTIDGRLVCIPGRFYINTVVGRTSQVGSQRGWTMEEVIALAEQYPGSKLIDRVNFEYILKYFCYYYIMDSFIDWEEGECSFDSEEFCSLVKWIEEQSGGRIEMSYLKGEDYGNEAVPEDMLLLRETAVVLSDYAKWELYFGEQVNMKGYPSGDGRLLYTAMTDNLIGIVAGSDKKEGAWQFLEQMLSSEEVNDFQLGFPIRVDSLMKRIEKEMTPEMNIPEEGVVYKSDMKAKNYFMLEGESIPYYYMTKEQADVFLEAVKNMDFTPQREVEDEIIEIVMEELRPYLYRTKTLQEVTQIIQNRIQMIVQEMV